MSISLLVCKQLEKGLLYAKRHLDVGLLILGSTSMILVSCLLPLWNQGRAGQDMVYTPMSDMKASWEKAWSVMREKREHFWGKRIKKDRERGGEEERLIIMGQRS